MVASSSSANERAIAAGVDFDRVAGWYDALAGLAFAGQQRAAQRAALAALPPGAPRVLILGGGSGWVLTEVLRRRPAATVLYLDASAAMLARAQRRLQLHGAAQQAQVAFRLGTEQDLRPDEQFEAILTFFVLDCMTPAQLPPAVARLAAALAPGAPWLLAEFAPARGWWQQALHRAMYGFFRVVAGLRARQLPDYGAALRGQGLVPAPAHWFCGGLLLGQVFWSVERGA